MYDGDTVLCSAVRWRDGDGGVRFPRVRTIHFGHLKCAFPAHISEAVEVNCSWLKGIVGWISFNQRQRTVQPVRLNGFPCTHFRLVP